MGYRTINKLSRFISPYGTKTVTTNKTDVVYKIRCNDCDASYVGQTERKLKTRIKEHMNNFKLDPSRHSVLTEHMRELNHSFDWNNVLILDVEYHYQKRLISEMFHIKSQSRGINLKKSTELTMHMRTL